jgi:hypothetical protein
LCPRKIFKGVALPQIQMGTQGSLFRFTTIYPEVVERPFDPFDKLRTGRLTVLSNVEGHQVYAGYRASP